MDLESSTKMKDTFLGKFALGSPDVITVHVTWNDLKPNYNHHVTKFIVSNSKSYQIYPSYLRFTKKISYVTLERQRTVIILRKEQFKILNKSRQIRPTFILETKIVWAFLGREILGILTRAKQHMAKMVITMFLRVTRHGQYGSHQLPSPPILSQICRMHKNDLVLCCP